MAAVRALKKSPATISELRYAVAESHLGWIVVAESERGIAMISFIDSPRDALAELAKHFPGRVFVDADRSFDETMKQIVAYIQSPERGLDLPIDASGTPFQLKVRKAIQAIPAGETATYSDVAAAVGKPAAVRAVANVCASNILAMVVPCHRVVRADGSMTGFGWGIERKVKMLEREQRLGHRAK